MLPDIYTLVGCPIIGELGPSTQVRDFPVCPKCNRRRRPVFDAIEYRFDRWAGEDLVTAMRCYAISERLRKSLQTSEISGATYEEITASKADHFEITEPAYSDSLPPFYRLSISGRCNGPELWWTSWTCEACGIIHWDRTGPGRHAAVAHITGDIGIPREVFSDSWQNTDIFLLDDPGPPIVTQHFADVLGKTDVAEVFLHPAKWVTRE